MSSILDFEPELRQAIVRLEPHTPFVEVLAQRSSDSEVRLDRSVTSVRESPQIAGAAIRSWGGDRWVEVASPLDPRALAGAISDLRGQLERARDRRSPPGEPTVGSMERVGRPARAMADVPMEERVRWAEELRGWAMSTPQVIDSSVVLGSEEDERLYLNSAGARRYQVVPRTFVVVASIASEGGKVRSDSLRVGGVGGRERIDQVNEAQVQELAKSSVALLHARTPPLGEMNVILDPGVAGVLAHESFGHGTEADQFVRERSYLRPIMGSRVGPDCLSIVDDGSLPTGWGSMYFDDEGRETGPTPLIDHGKFVGILHDRTTAALLGGKPTGNARRADFLSRVWVRMTNTTVVPGDRTPEELMQEAKEGVLLERWVSGIEDPLGGQMQIKVLMGHRFERGERTDLLGPMALSGRVLDVLRAVRGVSRADPMHIDIGFCGKGHGDYIPDGTGGAYLSTRAIVGPTA